MKENMQVSTCWDRELPEKQSLSILRGLALRHARQSGGYAPVLTDLLNRGKWSELVHFKLSYYHGDSVDALLNARQCLGFFQKLEWLDIGVDKERVAYEGLLRTESVCSQVNKEIIAFRHGLFAYMPPVASAISRARGLIQKVLGPCPRLVDLRLRFGPGATTSLKRSEANPMNKFVKGWQCSKNVIAGGYLRPLLAELPHWGSILQETHEYLRLEDMVEIHRGRLSFVPKSAKTHRGIVVEPVLNTIVQSGIGSHMAKRLRAAGIDIKDQTLNKRLARQGSIDGSLATIDLSSASDSISTQLVKELLPDEWYDLLNAFRTNEVEYRGNTIALQMFSSMGNGFTFPLETLIFWALARAAVPHGTVSAYGDDVICPSAYYGDVVRVYQSVGFSVNLAKSYSDGPFRESCGGDYFKGIDIRPFYQKHLISGKTLFLLHNFYYRNFDKEGCNSVLSCIPLPLRLYGPDGYGDGHLLSEEWSPNAKRTLRARDKGYGGVLFDSFTLQARRDMRWYPGDYVSPLYSIYSAGRDDLGLVTGLVDTEFGVRWSLPGSNGYKRISIYTLG